MGGRTFECLDAVINRYIIASFEFREKSYTYLIIQIPLFHRVPQISKGTNRGGPYFGPGDGNRT